MALRFSVGRSMEHHVVKRAGTDRVNLRFYLLTLGSQDQVHHTFEALYPEGMCPGWSVIVKGETSSSTSMFEINLLCDPGDQIAFHFNPRFSSSRIVCNSFLANHWGKEEVNNIFPFEAKESFQVEIYSDHDYFHIFINENKILQYKHRQKNLSSITKLQILNDIAISSVEITKRGLF
ncbi:grifin [Eudromia elegans]